MSKNKKRSAVDIVFDDDVDIENIDPAENNPKKKVVKTFKATPEVVVEWAELFNSFCKDRNDFYFNESNKIKSKIMCADVLNHILEHGTATQALIGSSSNATLTYEYFRGKMKDVVENNLPIVISEINVAKQDEHFHDNTLVAMVISGLIDKDDSKMPNISQLSWLTKDEKSNLPRIKALTEQLVEALVQIALKQNRQSAGKDDQTKHEKQIYGENVATSRKDADNKLTEAATKGKKKKVLDAENDLDRIPTVTPSGQSKLSKNSSSSTLTKTVDAMLSSQRSNREKKELEKKRMLAAKYLNKSTSYKSDVLYNSAMTKFINEIGEIDENSYSFIAEIDSKILEEIADCLKPTLAGNFRLLFIDLDNKNVDDEDDNEH